MYQKIMVPVDLGHVDALGRSLQVAADLAKHYSAEVTYVGVTAETPGPLGHNPKEYATALDVFTATQVDKHGHSASSVAYASHDPAIELDKVLLTAAKETAADLIVMASHVPALIDRLWPAHGAEVARKTDISVMLVR